MSSSLVSLAEVPIQGEKYLGRKRKNWNRIIEEVDKAIYNPGFSKLYERLKMVVVPPLVEGPSSIWSEKKDKDFILYIHPKRTLSTIYLLRELVKLYRELKHEEGISLRYTLERALYYRAIEDGVIRRDKLEGLPVKPPHETPLDFYSVRDWFSNLTVIGYMVMLGGVDRYQGINDEIARIQVLWYWSRIRALVGYPYHFAYEVRKFLGDAGRTPPIEGTDEHLVIPYNARTKDFLSTPTV